LITSSICFITSYLPANLRVILSLLF